MNHQGKSDVSLLLADSLKELAKTHPIDKITIKQITDMAGVIRPTFYNHFQDKYDLMEWIIQTELVNPIRPLIVAGLWEEAMTLLFTNILNEKAYYTNAVKMEGPVLFDEVVVRSIHGALVSIITEMREGKEPSKDWITVDMLAQFYAKTICLLMSEWVKSGMKASPREMAEVSNFLYTHSMIDVIKEM